MDLLLEGNDNIFIGIQVKFRKNQNSKISWGKDKLSHLIAHRSLKDFIVFSNCQSVDKTTLNQKVNIQTFLINELLSLKREAVFWQETERHKLKLNSLDFNNYMTFEDCVNRFFEDARTRMILSTSQKYESQNTYFCSSPLAKVKMSELKGFKVVEWIGWLKKQPTAKNPRRKSFIKEFKLLKTILYWYKNFLNEDFNVPVTKKHRQMCLFKPIAPSRPDYFIKPEDARNWIEWLKSNNSNPVYWRLASFMLLTGARVSEACGLKWEALDLEKGIARVVRRVRRVRWDHKTKLPFLEDITKTAQSARILVLPKRVQEILFQMKKEATNDLVFTNRQGGLLKYNAIQSAFNAGFMALNFPWC